MCTWRSSTSTDIAADNSAIKAPILVGEEDDDGVPDDEGTEEAEPEQGMMPDHVVRCVLEQPAAAQQKPPATIHKYYSCKGWRPTGRSLPPTTGGRERKDKGDWQRARVDLRPPQLTAIRTPKASLPPDLRLLPMESPAPL